MKWKMFLIIWGVLLVPDFSHANEISFLRPQDYEEFYTLIPEFKELETISLNGTWKYKIDDSDMRGQIEIPSSYRNYSGKITFSRSFILDESLSEKRIFVAALGLRHRCRIWLNDEVITTLEGLCVKTQLPRNLIKPGKRNILEIEVDNSLHPSNTIPLLNGYPRPPNYGGLTGDVFLIIEDNIGIGRLMLDPSLDQAKDTGTLNYSFDIETPPLESVKGSFTIDLQDANGRIVFIEKRTIGDANIYSGGITIENPERWEISNPYLYTFRVNIDSDDGANARIMRKIGFRFIDVADDIYLNGNKYKLRGITYNSVNKNGKTFEPHDYLNDLKLILQSGANCLMLTEPANPYLYHLCDSLGVLIFQSSSLNGVPRRLLEQESFSEMSTSHWNSLVNNLSFHPSIIAWIAARNVKWSEGIIEDYTLFRSGSSTPVFIEIDSEPNRLVKIAPNTGIEDKFDGVTEIGVFQRGKNKEYETLRTEKILNLISKFRSSDVIFLMSFSDFQSDRNLLFINPGEKPDLFGAGIVDTGRNPKNVFIHLEESWFETPPSIPVNIESNAPIVFPLTGFIFIGVFLLYYRANKLFRIQLRRVFAHAHGFLLDIRNGRYVQSTHSFLVSFGAASVLALLTSNTLHYARFSRQLDFILAHLIPNTGVHSYVLNVIWNPANAVFHTLVIYYVIIFVIAVIFRINTFILRGKTGFRRTFVMTEWSLVPLLLLSPLTIIFYQALSFIVLKYFLAALIFMVLVWTLSRVIYAIKIANSRGTIKTVITFITINIIVIAGLVSFLQHKYAFITYWEYIRP